MVAHSISPSDTVQLHREHLIGFCTDLGGRTSHTAIIANALEIPAVVGLHNISASVETGQTVVVDGNRGVVYIDPSEELWRSIAASRRDYSRQQAQWLEVRDRLAVTEDGTAISLRANVELPEDSELERALRRRGCRDCTARSSSSWSARRRFPPRRTTTACTAPSPSVRSLTGR